MIAGNAERPLREAIVTPDTRRRMAWALTGVGFVLFSGSGILFSTLLAPDPYPSPFGPPLGPQTDIARYFTEARPQVEAMSFVYTVAAALFICYAAFVSNVVRRAEDPTSPYPNLALSGGILAGSFWQLSALFLWVLARPATVEEPGLLRAMHDLTYLFGGPAHVLTLALFVGATSIALRDLATMPRWLVWTGIAAAAISLLGAFALLWDPATLLLPVGRGLALLWILALSGLLALRPS